ncbi:cytochrome P450 [Micromonospora maritima]|uniref:Cytochrome P450 n=1 Tax=Micromonospora maritima TaxID=986711 RepID=A0ABW7ZF82_9ACTN
MNEPVVPLDDDRDTGTVATTRVDLEDVDLFARGEHHAVLAWLRRHRPVYAHPARDGGSFWVLTRYEDVLSAYREHTVFSSECGAMLGGSFRSVRDSAAGRMLVASDLPRHRMLRQVFQPMFAPAMLDAVGRQITHLVDDAVRVMLEDGGTDFATTIATELPAGALMAMMNVGHAEAHEIVGLTRRMIGFRDPTYVDTTGDVRLRLASLQNDIFDFFADLVRSRRRNLGEDAVSMLIRARVNGRPLPESEILYNCMNLAVGGNETSSYSACSGLLALIENPTAYDALLARPSLLGGAVEEILRWSSVNAYVQRSALRDVEIGGQLIREGDAVTLWSVSANRDEAQFPQADRFIIDRSPNRHVSFGSGIHRCVGATVANVELTAAFSALVSRGVRLSLAGPVRRLRSNFILGTTSLPVRVVD